MQLVLWVAMVVGLIVGTGSWMVAVSLLPTISVCGYRIYLSDGAAGLVKMVRNINVIRNHWLLQRADTPEVLLCS